MSVRSANVVPRRRDYGLKPMERKETEESQVSFYSWSTQPQSSSSVSILEKMVEKLSMELKKLKTHMSRNQGSWSQGRQSSGPQRRSREFWYYHNRFRKSIPATLQLEELPTAGKLISASDKEDSHADIHQRQWRQGNRRTIA